LSHKNQIKEEVIDLYAINAVSYRNIKLFLRQLAKTNLTVNANSTTFVYTMNIDAEMLLSHSFIVDTHVSMAKAIAFCKAINNPLYHFM